MTGVTILVVFGVATVVGTVLACAVLSVRRTRPRTEAPAATRAERCHEGWLSPLGDDGHPTDSRSR